MLDYKDIIAKHYVVAEDLGVSGYNTSVNEARNKGAKERTQPFQGCNAWFKSGADHHKVPSSNRTGRQPLKLVMWVQAPQASPQNGAVAQMDECGGGILCDAGSSPTWPPKNPGRRSDPSAGYYYSLRAGFNAWTHYGTNLCWLV